ncbi:MAG: hypothetical protein AAFQ94_10340 [Bacteroidota bacterium]
MKIRKPGKRYLPTYVSKLFQLSYNGLSASLMLILYLLASAQAIAQSVSPGPSSEASAHQRNSDVTNIHLFNYLNHISYE